MHPTIQKVLNLIDQNRIDEAFDEIESLKVPDQPLAQLRQEFEGGYFGVNSVQRLKLAVRSLDKRLAEQKRTPPTLTFTQKQIEDYLAFLKEQEEEIRPRGLDGTREIISPDVEAGFEKLIGKGSTLKPINWFAKAIRASKSVCRVVLSNGRKGTGFVVQGGYLLTNWHVIRGKEDVARAKLEFNYEQDENGNAQPVATYFLDAEQSAFSHRDNLDFAYVKIRDNPAVPLSQWNFLEIDTFSEPQPGQSTIIIQHPEGEPKQFAFGEDDILGTWKQFLFYETDTLGGSSGSPVLNNELKVIALHHYGKNEAEGGVQINEAGDKRAANRGVLMKDIMNELKNQLHF
jgi:V8-like Glu-specific endopeptidase